MTDSLTKEEKELLAIYAVKKFYVVENIGKATTAVVKDPETQIITEVVVSVPMNFTRANMLFYVDFWDNWIGINKNIKRSDGITLFIGGGEKEIRKALMEAKLLNA